VIPATRTRARTQAVLSTLALAVGLAFCLLLLGYARHSWSYDSHVPDAKRVYVVKHKRNWDLGKPWEDQMPLAMRIPAQSIAGIEAVTGYTNWFPFNLEVDGGLQEVRSLTALPGFTELMGIQAAQGDLDAALSRPDAIALTESAARRLFGTTAVLGRTVKMRLDAVDANVATVRIDAIVRDPPSNTTIPFELLSGLDLTILPPWAKNEALYGEMGFQGGYLLVRLRADASVDQVTATLQKLADDSPLAARVPEIVRQRAGKDKFVVIKLSPLTDAYMDDEVQPNFFSVDIPRGDPRLVAGLAAVGLLLLALAAINYVNLATLRVLNRTREIMLRKVLGVSRRRLAWLFARESLLASLLAVGAGVGLAVLALPAFGTLMNRDLAGMLTPANLALAIALGLVVGLLTALYPVWLALRVRPARILSGRDAGETTRRSRWVSRCRRAMPCRIR
jgi:putative ABC transport system permease protein